MLTKCHFFPKSLFLAKNNYKWKCMPRALPCCIGIIAILGIIWWEMARTVYMLASACFCLDEAKLEKLLLHNFWTLISWAWCGTSDISLMGPYYVAQIQCSKNMTPKPCQKGIGVPLYGRQMSLDLKHLGRSPGKNRFWAISRECLNILQNLKVFADTQC